MKNYESEEDKQLFESVGMNGVLTKPFKKDKLLKVILNQFENSNENAPNTLENQQSILDPLYNLNTLREMSQGDKGFLTSIVETFIQNTPIYLEQIKTGFQSNDFNMVYRAAHQMKPSIDFFNIEKGKAVVRAIELEAKNENPNISNLDDLIDTLNDLIVSCVENLKADLIEGL